MDAFEYYFYYFSAVFSGYPLVIKITILIISILLFLTILSIFRFFYVRYWQRVDKSRRQKIYGEYHQKLVHILYFSFSKTNTDTFQNELGLPIPKKAWQKRLLTDLILEVKADNSYEMDGGVFQSKNYYNLLNYMKLFDYWVNEISSHSNMKAIKALRMVNEIGEGIKGSAFSRSVNHRKGYLRKLARMTYTRFDAHDPYRFLEHGFDNQFNKFDEKRLHYTLIEVNKDHPIPLLSKWIKNATKENYKCFLIREMGFFRQIEGTNYLLELYKIVDSQAVQCQILETLGELKYELLPNLAREEFKYASQSHQASLIEGLRRLNSKNSIPFLNEAYKNTQFSEIKIRIVQLLQDFKHDGLPVLISLSKTSNSEFEKNLFDYALS